LFYSIRMPHFNHTPLKPNYRPKINASEVAALIGEDPYITHDQALYKLLWKDKYFKEEIIRIKNKTDNYREKEVRDCLRELRPLAKEIACDVVTFKKNYELSGLIRSKVDELLDNSQPNLSSDAYSRVKEELIGEVNMYRGKLLEGLTIKALQERKQEYLKPGNVNTWVDNFGFYTVKAKIDAYLGDDTIIEIKNRIRPTNKTPLRDLIQLTMYLNITKRKHGILVEQYPSGKIAETKIDNNYSEFKRIHSKLVRMTFRIRNMTRNGLSKLIIQNDCDNFKDS
jgi:hypothetical protein